MAGVEANNHGLTTLTTLKHRMYPNIYQRDIIDSSSPDKKAKKNGWLTTRQSKLKIIDQLIGLLRDDESGIMCAETIDEMDTYILHDDGTYGAKTGCNDDRVMSYAIAKEVLFSMGGIATRTSSNNNNTDDEIMEEADVWG
jgi:hypothetical protein